MKKKRLLIYLPFILFTLFACNKSKNKVVDGGLLEYVDRFFEEADLRNVDVSDDNLEVIFRDLTDEGVCGLGHFRYLGTDLRKVEISTHPLCWDINADLGKESLVFHELGHAILKRTHNNSVMPNGLPARIMCDGFACNLYKLYDQYTLGKRKYYVDKLFNPGTPIPTWGRIRTKETPFIKEDFEGISPLGTFEISDLTYQNNFEHKITTNPHTNSKSIRIEAKERLKTKVSGNWVVRFENPSITEGVGLKASANITTEAMFGAGVTMILQTFSGDDLDLSGVATNRTTIISGTQQEQVYSIDLGYFPSDVKLIALTLQVLPNTSGTVYFDDLSLNTVE